VHARKQKSESAGHLDAKVLKRNTALMLSILRWESQLVDPKASEPVPQSMVIRFDPFGVPHTM
jgi:hypothetical protein